MVSRRKSWVLLVVALLVAWLVRLLLDVERPTRSTEAEASAATPARDARPTRPLETSLPEPARAAVNGRVSLPTGPPPASVPPRAAAPALRPDRSAVFVSVLDARGRPAPDVTVGLSNAFLEPADPADRSGIPARWMPIDEGVTDAGGGVELRYLAPEPLELAGLRMRIAPLLAFDELPAFETELAQLPPPTVVLRLPPTGSIRVRVEPAELATRAKASVEAVIGERLLRRIAVTEGVALFALVELGHEVELRLTTATMGNRPSRRVVRGPEAPDEIVDATLVLDAWPTLRFCVNDELGRPLPNSSFSARIHHGKLSPQAGSAKTDDRGVAEFVVYGAARNEDVRELLVWSTSPPRLARLWLPEVLETPTELGNITLHRVAPDSVPPP